jgi:hypothetical protein
LIFCASSLSLWGTGPGEANDDDDESLLQSQLALLEDTSGITVEMTRNAIESFRVITGTTAPRINQSIRDEEAWGVYIDEFDRMRAAYLEGAAKIAVLKQLAVAIRDAALHGLYPTYLPDGDVTDPIMEAWAAFSITLHNPSRMD